MCYPIEIPVKMASLSVSSREVRHILDKSNLQTSKFTLNDIKLARKNIEHYIEPTPVISAKFKSREVGLKLEVILPTRSFKIRGTLNALSQCIQKGHLSQECVTASTGNHGIALAFAAKTIGTVANVVLPTNVSPQKVEAIKNLGGNVIMYGATFDEAESYAHELERRNDFLYISSYESIDVIAGQGTIALELLTQYPAVTMIIVPVGGGGLLGGIAFTCAQVAPQVKVIGAQGRATPAMYNHLYNTNLPQKPSLAHGLAGRVDEESLGLALCRQYVKRIVLVEEDAIQMAMQWYIFEQGLVIEGSSACAVAALQSGSLDWENETVVVIASGSNVDRATLQRVICMER